MGEALELFRLVLDVATLPAFGNTKAQYLPVVSMLLFTLARESVSRHAKWEVYTSKMAVFFLLALTFSWKRSFDSQARLRLHANLSGNTSQKRSGTLDTAKAVVIDYGGQMMPVCSCVFGFSPRAYSKRCCRCH